MKQYFAGNRQILWIFGLALLVRMGFWVYFLLAIPQKLVLINMDDYYAIAQNLWQHGVYSASQFPPFLTDLTRPPGYPVFLWFIFSLFGADGTIISLFQIVIGSITSVMIYLIAKEFHFPEAAALVAGGVFALEPNLILLSFYPLSETLFLGLFSTGFWLLVRILNGHFNLKNSLAAGIFFGLSSLTRPIALYFPLLLPFLWLVNRKKSPISWKPVLVSGLIAMLLPLLWAVRNDQTADIFTVSNIADINLYDYRAKAVWADVQGISQEEASRQLRQELAEYIQRKHPTPGETYQYMRMRGMEILLSHPLETLQMTLKGAVRLMADPGFSLVCAQLDSQIVGPECFSGGATMLVTNPLVMIKDKFIQMNRLQQGLVIWGVLLLGILYLGCAVGIISLVRVRKWGDLTLLLIPALYFLILSMGAESLYRLRLPAEIFLALLAGSGVHFILSKLLPDSKVHNSPKIFLDRK